MTNLDPLIFTHTRTLPSKGGIRGRVVAWDGVKETDIGYALENQNCEIPPGFFAVKLHTWTVNNKPRAWLQKVPGRTFILIHELNRPSQSKGCIGVASGVVRDAVDWIVGSTAQKVADMTAAALAEGREVWWEVLQSQAVKRWKA